MPRSITIAITGRATAHDLDDDDDREKIRGILDGAEIHTEIDGVAFTLTIEHDPHAAD